MSQKNYYQIKYNFNGSPDKLILTFFNKIKPIPGIIKYKMINWKFFPLDIVEAKELSKKWIEEFNSNSKYNGLFVNIYFNIKYQVIKFILKEKNINNVILKEDNYKTSIINFEPYIVGQKTKFYITNLNINTKEESKNVSLDIVKELENKYNNKFVVFINYKFRYIKVIMN